MTVTASAARFDMGRVVQRTFGAIARNFVVFALAGVLFAALPRLAQGLLTTQLGLSSTGTAGATPPVGGWGVYVGAFLFTTLLTIICTYVLQAALLHGTIADLNGRRATLGECIATGFRKFLPLLGLAILSGIAFMLGFILLIVPAFILMTMWAVATPVLVVERRGVTESLSRSADLTRGNRWMIFGLLVVYIILLYMILGALTGVGFALGQIGGQGNIGIQIGTAVAQTITGVVSAAGIASLYYELRFIKEGVEPEQLASIFD